MASEQQQRQLAVILHADIEGSTALVRHDEPTIFGSVDICGRCLWSPMTLWPPVNVGARLVNKRLLRQVVRRRVRPPAV